MNAAELRKHNIPAEVSIRHDLGPGDVDAIIALHGELYTEEYGWDKTFREHVAGPLKKFANASPDRSRIWIVEQAGKLVGSVAIVEVSQANAQLRWLLLHPKLRKKGLGRFLIEDALSFCRDQGYQLVFLWTEARLTAAAKLYRLFDFLLAEEKTHKLWGTTVTEQRYDLRF